MSHIKIIFLAFIPLLLTACDKGQETAQPTSQQQAEPASVEITLQAGCSICHGIDGASSRPGVPFIAGQAVGYLEQSMRSYLVLDRRHEVMRQAVFDIDADQRKSLATYFANSKASWKDGKETESDSAGRPTKAAIRAGEAISKSCESCHGKDGNSVKVGVPSLAGLQPEYFVPAIKDYLTGRRKGAAIMKNFKLSLSDKDLNNLAAYYSVQQRKKSPLGEKLLKTVPSSALVPRCVGCHGDNGDSTHPAMPSLSGQNANYLIKAMQTYRDGKRRNQMMVNIAKGLSDEEIEQNATYFATREPATIKVSISAKKARTKFDPLGNGAELAASCNGCHGEKGNNPAPGTPRLAGLSYAYLQNAIAAYRDGKRKHNMMQMLTKFLSETDIEKISYYYANQTPVISSRQGKVGNEKSGMALASGCAGCHGEDGNSQDIKVPSLAGQDAEYLVTAIGSYKDKGTRTNGDMNGVAQELDKNAINNLAQYYSRLAPKGVAPRLLEGPDELSKKCDRCHGDNGANPDPDKPRIAGQRQSYLSSALHAYKKGDRTHSTMQAMTRDMWTVEIEAIAAFYAAK
ncbi:c-type cytochrome [Kaarinaea lacus]